MMIQQAETLIEYGYLPMDLAPQSKKPILAACDDCGKVRVIRKDSYHDLCVSCSLKGKEHALGCKHTKEANAKTSGEKNYWFGVKGKNHPKWKGGTKIARARTDAKRDRNLGHVLLMPLNDGEVGHHVTNEYVIGIPEEVHEKLSGYKRQKHRTLMLQWLKMHDKKKYKIVLCILAKEPIRSMI